MNNTTAAKPAIQRNQTGSTRTLLSTRASRTICRTTPAIASALVLSSATDTTLAHQVRVRPLSGGRSRSDPPRSTSGAAGRSSKTTDRRTSKGRLRVCRPGTLGGSTSVAVRARVNGGAADAEAGDEVGDGLAAVAQRPDLPSRDRGQPWRPSGVSAAEPGSGSGGSGAFVHELALVLGEGGEDAGEHPSGEGGVVDALPRWHPLRQTDAWTSAPRRGGTRPLAVGVRPVIPSPR